MYWLVLACGVLFMGWTHTHTDEIPIVLGLAGIVSAAIGLIFPARLLPSGLLLGSTPFVAETLVFFGVLHAPYPPGQGLPWPALIAVVPVAAGLGIGYGIRASGSYSTHRMK